MLILLAAFSALLVWMAYFLCAHLFQLPPIPYPSAGLTAYVLIPGIWWTIGWCLFAIALYAVRQRFRFAYAVVELLVGILVILSAIVTALYAAGNNVIHPLILIPSRYVALLQVGGGVYVVVRGLDNLGEGLKAYPKWHARWLKAFAKKVFPD